jgi:hypothetical protein
MLKKSLELKVRGQPAEDDRNLLPESLVLVTRPQSQGSGAKVETRASYCFFSGIAGVTGCAPPVDFGPGVAPALFSELLAAE